MPAERTVPFVGRQPGVSRCLIDIPGGDRATGQYVTKEVASLIDGAPLLISDLDGEERRTGVVRNTVPNDLSAPVLLAGGQMVGKCRDPGRRGWRRSQRVPADCRPQVWREGGTSDLAFDRWASVLVLHGDDCDGSSLDLRWHLQLGPAWAVSGCGNQATACGAFFLGKCRVIRDLAAYDGSGTVAFSHQ